MEGTEPTVANSDRIAPVPREGGRQVIPRPPTAHAGSPAPWAEMAEEDRRRITVARVRRAVTGAGEGAAGGLRLPPDGFPDPGSPAAVLVVLFDEDEEGRVVLTRRAAHLRSHRGEVSFPGGKMDAGETAEEGALRESAEEIGLDPAPVELVGRLTAVTTFASGSTIVPVVGLLRGRPELVPSPTEVEHVFDVALADLADPGIFREEWWTVPGTGATGAFPVWFFELPDDTVWGATARMIVDLLHLVLAV
ncbi:MAG TPA: CoA pyrophosphatase [Acidimicrobiales bacterium]|nr:CoA pyrophosphatase [Acidimicrobiales bacterium]